MDYLKGYRTYLVFAVWGAAALATRYGFQPTGDEQALIDQVIGLLDHPLVAVVLAWIMRTKTDTPPGQATP